MNRRYKNTIKNKVLITINYIMALILILSICALDSQSNIPFYTCLVSGLYLILSAYANGLIGKLTR